MTKQTKILLYAGLPAALLFWINTAVCGWIHGNYNHLSGTISELGALGTRSQTVFSAVVLTISLLGICFFVGAFRACRETGLSIVPVLPVILLALSLAGIAFYPQGTNFHPIAGQFSIPVLFGPILVIFFWRGKKLFALRVFSLICLALMCAALLLVLTGWVSPEFKQQYGGFIQRLFHAGWTLWFAVLSICLPHLPRLPKTAPRQAYARSNA
jgi:hypothetical membrane protein